MKFPSNIKSAVRGMNRGFAMMNRSTYPYRNKRGDGFLLVLKVNGTTQKWDILARINNYGIGDNFLRQKKEFTIATLEKTFGLSNNQSFNDIIKVATHIAILPQNEFFSLRDGDENNVTFVNFYWTLFASSIGDRFTDLELANIYGTNEPPSLPVLSADSNGWSWTQSEDDFTSNENIEYVIEIDIV